MVNPRRFYTYAYLSEDRTPYYIGKGQGERLYRKGKGEIKPPKDESRIIFLKQNLTEEEAFAHEKYLIFVIGRLDLKTGPLLNRTAGGQGCSGVILSEETKRKISEANRGKFPTEETRKKLSEAQRGRVHSEETKRKISEGNKGKKLSEEARKKISDGNKRKKLSESHKFILEKYRVKKHSAETIEKIRKSKLGNKWNVGRKLSEEHKEKIKRGNLNKILSEETKRKISEAKRGKQQSDAQKQSVKMLAVKIKGTKWWNNGQICKRSVECPGDGWILGRVKIIKM